jgi:formylglycine-generating enzyme required for sulfatase activity
MLSKGSFQVDETERRILDDQGRLVCFFDAHRNGDQLHYEQGKISAAEGRDYFPLTNVSWFGASAYAAYTGGRLPTETEWVRAAGFWDDSLHTYAVEAGQPETLATAINFDGSRDPAGRGKYPQSLPSGFLPPNGNGLYEMSGNVWEWCSDWYYSKYYRQLTKTEQHRNPQGPESGTMRTFKGGSWAAGLDVTKVRYRVALAPGLALAELGFRVVWDDK